jgi:hypothetical protein
MGAGKSSVSNTFNSHAIAATISLAVARLFGLREAYWAAIATLVVMQSTLGATLLISIERIAATALGALAGALLATWFTGNIFIFAAAVFVLGLLCAAFRMEKSAYRYASITLAIIVLIPRSKRRLDHCAPPLLRSLGWNRRRPGACRCVAGASTCVCKTERRVNGNCSGGRVARDPRILQPARCGHRRFA